MVGMQSTMSGAMNGGFLAWIGGGPISEIEKQLFISEMKNKKKHETIIHLRNKSKVINKYF